MNTKIKKSHLLVIFFSSLFVLSNTNIPHAATPQEILKTQDGYLRITTKIVSTPQDIINNGIALTQDISSEDFEAEIKLTFDPASDGQEAGIAVWQDDANFLTLSRELTQGANRISFKKEAVCCAGTADFSQTIVYLKVIKGGNTYIAYYSTDGAVWNSIGTYSNITFSNIKIGLYGISDNAAPVTTADFSYFKLTSNPANTEPNGVIDTPASNVTVTAGDSISFTATAADPENNTPFTFSWDFGGGAANSADEDPGNVQFNTPGVYTVSFTVTDNFGLSDSSPETREITVVKKEEVTISPTDPTPDPIVDPQPSPAPPAPSAPANLDIPSESDDGNSVCFILTVVSEK